MSEIAFLFTCYNRIDKSKSCIESVEKAVCYAKSEGADIKDEWFVCDAGSSDNTAEMLKSYGSKMHIREEDEQIYYSQGMRIAMEMVQESGKKFDYIVLVNDDVVFYEDFLYKAVSNIKETAVIVGATDYDGKQTYGGIRYHKPVGRKSIFPRSVGYKRVAITDADRRCDTFNANCVIIPAGIFYKCPIIDNRFVHSLGDFDYGMTIKENGFDIESTDYYVGRCANNSRKGTYLDTELSRRERISKLKNVKGAPTGPWFYYLKKHFGFSTALIYAISPYIKILLGK